MRILLTYLIIHLFILHCSIYLFNIILSVYFHILRQVTEDQQVQSVMFVTCLVL